MDGAVEQRVTEMNGFMDVAERSIKGRERKKGCLNTPSLCFRHLKKVKGK